MLEHRVLVSSILCLVLLNWAERVTVPQILLLVRASLKLRMVSDLALLNLFSSCLHAGCLVLRERRRLPSSIMLR